MPARTLVGVAYSFDSASDSRAVTIPADCEVLEISVSTISSGQDQTSVTCGGPALAKIGASAVHSGGKPRVNAWFLVGPPTGSQTIVVTNASGDKTGVEVFSHTDIDDTAPFDGWDTATGTSAGPQASGPAAGRLQVPSAVGDRVCDTIASLSTQTQNPGGGQTELADFMPVDGRMASSHKDGAGGSSVDMTWQTSGGESKEWAAVAFNANAPAGGGGGTKAPPQRPAAWRRRHLINR